MQPDNIGRPSACRFQRGEALISSCSDQGHGHHRQRHVRVKAKLDPKPVKLHWCRTVSRWPRASEEDAASGLRQSRSSRARFSAGRHGSARGCPGNATARCPSASPTPYRGLDRQRSQARRGRAQQCTVTRLAGARPDRAHAVHICYLESNLIRSRRPWGRTWSRPPGCCELAGRFWRRCQLRWHGCACGPISALPRARSMPTLGACPSIWRSARHLGSIRSRPDVSMSHASSATSRNARHDTLALFAVPCVLVCRTPRCSND